MSKQSTPWAFLDRGNALDLICLDFSNTFDKRATWEIIVCVGRSGTGIRAEGLSGNRQEQTQQVLLKGK